MQERLCRTGFVGPAFQPRSNPIEKTVRERILPEIHNETRPHGILQTVVNQRPEGFLPAQGTIVVRRLPHGTMTLQHMVDLPAGIPLQALHERRQRADPELSDEMKVIRHDNGSKQVDSFGLVQPFQSAKYDVRSFAVRENRGFVMGTGRQQINSTLF